MKLYLRSNKKNIDAVADYDIAEKKFTVLKGSIISKNISSASSFRGVKPVKEWRERYVRENVLIEDVAFKSPSTAANFVTGSSTNGLLAWKNENGEYLRKLIKNSDENEEEE